MKEGKRKRRISDPAWKSGPPDPPEPTASEHSWYEEPHLDFDGVGRDEATVVDGEPLVCVHETNTCRLDNCNTSKERRHVYTDNIDTVIADEVVENVDFEVVDFDDGEPIISTVDGNEYIYPEETFVVDSGSEPCYGVEEPSPEPYGL